MAINLDTSSDNFIFPPNDVIVKIIIYVQHDVIFKLYCTSKILLYNMI